MTGIPIWVQVLQALLTPTVAVAVGIVAFLQWRTAHHKVILDLFDRRMAIYEAVERAIDYVLANEGNLVGHNASQKLTKAWMDSRFLFGSEVEDQIFEIKARAVALANSKNRSDRTNLSDADRLANAEQSEKYEDALMLYHELFSDTCRQYMGMDQKRIRTPREWHAERNRIRLSYADEKQR
ncbi:hypothetical protein V7794_24570 [Rhizobium laguerreae]